MTNYRFTSAALSELKQATLNYEAKEKGLGGMFLDEVDATVVRILNNPNAWHPLSGRTRRCRTHRFPFRCPLPDSFQRDPNHVSNGFAPRSHQLETSSMKYAALRIGIQNEGNNH